MNWFASPTGLRLLAAEQREVLPLLTQHIGVRGLYLRPAGALPATLSGNMLQSVMNLHQREGRLAGDLDADPAALPIENDALCLVYALHTLETTTAPEALLEELQRVLRPEGVLFLFGLSPCSLWRLRWGRQQLHARRAGRIRAMLAAAGLCVETQVGLGPLLPFVDGHDEAVPARHRDGSPFDAFRAGYLLVARKRRTPLTPIGARQRTPMNALQPQVGAG